MSAAEFNQRFNDFDANFCGAATQINANESNIGANASAISALDSGKMSVSGDSMTGALVFDADGGANDPVGSGINGSLRVNTTNSDGVAAYLSSKKSVPTLLVKNAGSGSILAALNASTGRGLEVKNEGHVLVGAQGAPLITLDGTTGDITLGGIVRNADGDRLTPVAYGRVDIGGTLKGTTSNVAAARELSPGRYEVDFTGLSFTSSVLVVATSINVSPAAQIVTWGVGDSNTLKFNVANGSGTAVYGNVAFVIYVE